MDATDAFRRVIFITLLLFSSIASAIVIHATAHASKGWVEEGKIVPIVHYPSEETQAILFMLFLLAGSNMLIVLALLVTLATDFFIEFHKKDLSTDKHTPE